MVGDVNQYIDMPSAIIVVVVGVLFALAGKADGSFIQKFGDGAVRTGWIGSIIGIIAIFGGEGFASGDMGANRYGASRLLFNRFLWLSFKAWRTDFRLKT